MALKDWTAPMVEAETANPIQAGNISWNPAPPSPSDGKQLVDSAALDGINKGINDVEYQKMAQEYAVNEAQLQQINNQLLQSGLLGPTPQEQAMYQSEMTNRYLTNLVGAKQAYQNAQFNQDEAGMANARLAGQQLREQGRAAGIDPALLSEDLTLDQARQLQGQLDWQSLFNGMSADDYYQVQYNRYRDQGMGYTAAKRAAGNDAANYQAQQASRASDALLKYGLNENGAINERGMQALLYMARNGGDGGREMANIIANMLPGPRDAYALNSQRTLMGDRQGYQQDNMRLGGEIDMKKAAQKHAYDEETANNNLKRTLALKEQEIGLNAMSIQAQAQARQSIIAPYVQAGIVSPDMAVNYISTGYLTPKGSKAANGATGFDDKRAKFLQGERDRLDGQIEEARASGDDAKVKKLESQRDEIQAELDSYTRGNSGDNSAVSVEPFGNYDEFITWAGQKMKENEQAGWPYSRDQMYQMFKARGGQWADDIPLDDWYGTSKASTPATSKTEEPATVKTSSYTAGTASGAASGKNAGKGLWDRISDSAMYEVYNNDRSKRIGYANGSDKDKYDIAYAKDGHVIFVERVE